MSGQGSSEVRETVRAATDTGLPALRRLPRIRSWPDIPGDATQIIDVRDLAACIIQAAEAGLTGAYNALGDVVPFGEYLAESQRVARATTDGDAPADGGCAHRGGYVGGARVG